MDKNILEQRIITPDDDHYLTDALCVFLTNAKVNTMRKSRTSCKANRENVLLLTKTNKQAL